jgi:carbon monoxide dehydrogenase subunit G
VLIENEFHAAAPVEDLWSFLLDVERIAPCMPGAELTETVDERTWKGKVAMKFGPVAMAFAGTVTMQERDDAAHRVVLAAKGTEQKGKGAANATVTSWLEPHDDGSSIVKMRADISLTGAAAQLSRGLLPEVSKKLTQQFADCLEQTLATSGAATGSGASPDPQTAAGRNESAPIHAATSGTTAAAANETGTPAAPTVPGAATQGPSAAPTSTGPATPAARPTAAKPVGGIRLGLSAIWAIVKNLLGRLFGGPARRA